MCAIPPARLPQWSLNPCNHYVGDLREIYDNTWDNDSFGSQCLRNVHRPARISSRPALVFLCQPASVLLHTLRVRSLSGAERLQIGRTGKLADTCAHKYLHQSARTSLRSPLLRHLRAARSANYQPRSRKCFQQHAANLDTGSNFTGTSDMIGLS